LFDTHKSQPLTTGRPRLFYGYIIVGAAVCIQILGWGLFNSYGVYFNQILAEFRWPRETISGAYSLSQIVIGISAIFMGSLNDRFGPRPLIVCGGILAGLGFVLISQTHSVWQLYLFQGVIVGIGLSGTDVVLLSTVARWFVKRRGIMSSIVKTGTGIGIMVMPIISAWLITLYGWRTTLIILGTTLFIIFVAGAQLLRRDPARMKQFPDGAERAEPGAVPMSEAGMTLAQAARTRQFWMVCGVYFVVFFVSNTLIVHVSPFATDLKVSAPFAAAMISIIGGVSIIGRLSMGLVSDKISCRRALLISFILLSAALVWLQTVNTMWALGIFTVVYGFAHGGFYGIMSPVVAEFFGTRAHGTIFGIVICAASIGGAIGPILAGRIFDKLASYQMAFLILLGMAVVGLVMTLLSGPMKKQAGGVDGSRGIKA
jgi:MFS family permease